jgi:prolyl 4-hydroxylase
MHHFNLSINYPWLPHNVDPTLLIPPEYMYMPLQPLGDRQAFYNQYMADCIELYNEADCWHNERHRIEMSLRQPQSMRNYTQLGYAKVKTPAYAYKLLKEFYDNNKHRASEEEWSSGSAFTYVMTLYFCE